MNPIRTALYCRVSTLGQTVEPQLLELRTYATQKGLTISHELTDVISGTKDSRAGLDKLMALVRAREVDAVMVVKIDRMCRSLSHFARLCDELKKHGVALIIPGQGIDTSNQNPCGEMQLGVLAVIAQFERSLISERTKAGLAVAKASGKILGRPSKLMPPPKERAEIYMDWHNAGRKGGYRELGRLLGGVQASTAWRFAQWYGDKGPEEPIPQVPMIVVYPAADPEVVEFD